MSTNLGKKYQTGLSESHRPDLQPNGKVVRCVEDKGNGYLIVTSEDEKEPNTWLVGLNHLSIFQKQNSYNEDL